MWPFIRKTSIAKNTITHIRKRPLHLFRGANIWLARGWPKLLRGAWRYLVKIHKSTNHELFTYSCGTK